MSSEDNATFPQEVERRRRRVSRAPLREPCDRCGGPLVLKIFGRDHRAVCAQCQLPSANCLCRPAA